MIDVLKTVTGIPALEVQWPIVQRSMDIAQIMSWASRRSTSREEDMAYCLLGLLEINMSLLYGEGRHAYTRLQKKLVKYRRDVTIFDWQAPDTSNGLQRLSCTTILNTQGMLAPDTSCFGRDDDSRSVGFNLVGPSSATRCTVVGNTIHVTADACRIDTGHVEFDGQPLEFFALRLDEYRKKDLIVLVKKEEHIHYRISATAFEQLALQPFDSCGQEAYNMRSFVIETNALRVSLGSRTHNSR